MRWYRRSDVLLVSILGDGGQARVYSAKLCLPERAKEVAVKIFKRESQAFFEREFTILASLRHEGLPKLIGAMEDEIGFALILEFFPGWTFFDILTRSHYAEKHLDITTIRYLADLILVPLAYLHKTAVRPIIHGDLSPENLILTPRFNVAIIDFGAAQFYGEECQAFRSFGKTEYLAPESFHGFLSFQADLFAMAAVIFELIAMRPFKQDAYGEEFSFLDTFFNGNLALLLLLKACLSPSPFYRPAHAAQALRFLPPLTDAEREAAHLKLSALLRSAQVSLVNSSCSVE